MPDDTEVLAPETDNPAQVTPEPTTPAAGQPAGQDTVAGGADTVAGDKEVPPDWRDDWREKMAGGDEKELKRLQRFRSPVDVYKSARELERKMSAGEIKAKLPDAATEEQIAAWRKDNGIPDKPDGYLEKLPKGLVIGDADKPLIDGFLARVHGKNADPAIVAEAVDWYYATQEEMLAAQAKSDKDYNIASTDALRAEWGNEYRANINSIASFLDAAPAMDDGTPLKGLLMNARLGDGTRLGDNPAALKWLAGLASDANPGGFVSPGDAGSSMDTIEKELDTIRQTMRTDRPKYDRDQRMQDRFDTLLQMKERLESRK